MNYFQISSCVLNSSMVFLVFILAVYDNRLVTVSYVYNKAMK